MVKERQKSMPNFIVSDDDNDIINRPKFNEDKRVEVGDIVSYPFEKGSWAMAEVVEVNTPFASVTIQPLAVDSQREDMPERFVQVQHKGVKAQ